MTAPENNKAEDAQALGPKFIHFTSKQSASVGCAACGAHAKLCGLVGKKSLEEQAEDLLALTVLTANCHHEGKPRIVYTKHTEDQVNDIDYFNAFLDKLDRRIKRGDFSKPADKKRARKAARTAAGRPKGKAAGKPKRQGSLGASASGTARGTPTDLETATSSTRSRQGASTESDQ